jgi:glucans biosynthesis protein
MDDGYPCARGRAQARRRGIIHDHLRPHHERRWKGGATPIMQRRSLIAALALGPVLGRLMAGRAAPAASAAGPQLGEGVPFSFDLLREQARTLAAAGYEPPPENVPEALVQLNYDQYRDIRFRPDAALWREEGLPFRVQFFHPGFFYRASVPVHVVKEGTARPVLYSADLFDYGHNEGLGGFSPDLGFAGFRIHTPLNRPDVFDELVVFLGASYFRALGRGQQYGKSARGLAIDTALPSGEEFPVFRAFWIEEPDEGAASVVVHALLDGPRIAGAFRLEIMPGAATVVGVTSALFPRAEIEKLGIAPLTSMYLFGENDRAGVDDFRPEVHDSDGLSLWTGAGESIWRPLTNPGTLRVSAFADRTPRGFGLMQRDRGFASYQDLEASYHLRPSAWIEPVGDWGEGSVQLVEIPSDSEINDNVVAMWVPAAPVVPGTEIAHAYRIHWTFEDPFPPVAARVAATWSGVGGVPGTDIDRASRKFVIDFVGGQLPSIPAEVAVEAVVSTSSGEVTQPIALRNPATQGWRAFFDLRPDGDGPIELRCFLRFANDALTETWSYQWTP